MPEPTFRLVITNPGLKTWPRPIAQGLEAAGAAFQSEMKRYPAKEVSAPLAEAAGKYRTINVFDSYRRTGTLGNTAHYQVSGGLEDDGMSMAVGGVGYMKYVLGGTGIYGPKHKPIRPVTKPLLAWRGAGGWHFAKEVRGMIWKGKLAKVKAELVRGFAVGFKKAMHKA